MAPLSHASLAEAISPVIAQPAPTDLGDKIYHLEARIESVEDAPKRDVHASDDPKLLIGSDSRPKDDANRRMQLWWEEAIAKNMDVSDTYSNVAVLIIKWADELDDLKTRAEVRGGRALQSFLSLTIHRPKSSMPSSASNSSMSPRQLNSTLRLSHNCK